MILFSASEALDFIDIVLGDIDFVFSDYASYFFEISPDYYYENYRALMI